MRLLSILCLTFFLACQSAPKEVAIPENPFAAIGDTAIMFAPGRISSEAGEFAACWSPELNLFAFNRIIEDPAKGSRAISIFFSSYENKTWTTPKAFEYSEAEGFDVDPFFFDQKLYFSAGRYVDTTRDDWDIYISEFEENNWSPPVKENLGLSTLKDDIFITSTKDGVAYYSIFEPDRTVSIYQKSLVDATVPVQKLQFLNDTARLTNPAIAPDGSFLLLSCGNLEGYGSADIYISYPTEDPNIWSVPENLGPTVNTSYTEFAPSISPDGKYLFFTSERPGMVPGVPEGLRPPGDIYVVLLSGLVR